MKLLILFIFLVSCSSDVEKPSKPSKNESDTTTVEPVKTSLKEAIQYVDELFPLSKELLKQREPDFFSSCAEEKSFSSHIEFNVNLHSKPKSSHLSHLAQYYQIPNKENEYTNPSLVSHKICNVDKRSLSKFIDNVPSQDVIDKINWFANNMNQSDTTTKKELWSQFFSCLAYTESLTTVDTESSYQTYKKYTQGRKPSGVKFYIDPYQTEASKLNIGVYQFTPDYGGNIYPCIKSWNEQKECKISKDSDMIEIVGSSSQAFNIYCGINKIVQSFTVQVNTTRDSRKFPNQTFENQCVTPFAQSTRVYNHFGPLQNSTGKNLDQLLTCTKKAFENYKRN